MMPFNRFVLVLGSSGAAGRMRASSSSSLMTFSKLLTISSTTKRCDLGIGVWLGPKHGPMFPVSELHKTRSGKAGRGRNLQLLVAEFEGHSPKVDISRIAPRPQRLEDLLVPFDTSRP